MSPDQGQHEYRSKNEVGPGHIRKRFIAEQPKLRETLE
jgi:hypothetical protein